MQGPLARAREVIRDKLGKAGYPVRKILLFGSRARGWERADSDWDFYVIIGADLDRRTREQIASRICWRLALEGIYTDIFIQSEDVVEQRRHDTGCLTYYVLKEGVEV